MAWNVIDNFFYLCLFFVLALLLKKTVPIFQRYIIPNSILAGFIGLILGPSIIGFGVRSVYNRLQNRGLIKEDYLNNFILQRISGGVFDFMVAASIGAVSFAHISEVFVPLIILTFLGGFITYIYLSFVIKRNFPENRFPNLIAMFGMQTGTISTGVALLREIDPAMESGAAENMVLGSGFSIMIGLPLIALLNVPVMGFVSGNSLYYLYFMAGMIIYGTFLGGVLFRRTR